MYVFTGLTYPTWVSPLNKRMHSTVPEKYNNKNLQIQHVYAISSNYTHKTQGTYKYRYIIIFKGVKLSLKAVTSLTVHSCKTRLKYCTIMLRLLGQSELYTSVSVMEILCGRAAHMHHSKQHIVKHEKYGILSTSTALIVNLTLILHMVLQEDRIVINLIVCN